MDNIKLEIFKAVISVGSNNQKDNWKAACNNVYEWVTGKDTEKSPSPRSKKAQKR